MADAGSEHRYSRLTWAEIDEAIGTVLETVRGSAVTAHADEFETSLYLHLAPERVQMDRGLAKAVDGIRAWPIEARRDMHCHPVQKGICW